MRSILLLLSLALSAGACRTQPLQLADGGVDAGLTRDLSGSGGALACSTDGTLSCGGGEVCCWTYAPAPAQGQCLPANACQADVAAACTQPSDCPGPGQVCCFHFLNRRTQFTDCLSASQCAAQQGQPLCPTTTCANRDCCNPMLGPAGAKVCTPGQCP